jgi:hypothetical protein
MLCENHSGTVKSVHTQLGSGSCIHGDAAYTTHVGERQNVRNGVFVIPDWAEVREVTNHSRVLETAVGEGTESVGAGADVGEHGLVTENGDGGL